MTSRRSRIKILTQRGSSLVEMMIVIAILGGLAAIAMPNYKKMEDKANYSASMTLMLGMQAVAMGIRPVERKTLYELGLTGCLFCVQNVTLGVRLDTVNAVWNPEVANDWGLLGYSDQPRDLWGSVFIADFNEGEFGPTDCRRDAIWSGGANQTWDGVGGNGYTASGDDIALAIPFFRQVEATCIP